MSEVTMSEVTMSEVTRGETQPPAELPEFPRGLNRLCRLIVGLVWPLIWVGGLVTTYDAGMSVPDWPGTYGYNLFLYPIQTWLFGPFDLFIEHGHRLLGAVVGLVAIAIVIAAHRGESRTWVKQLSIALLIMVIAQGALGGARVLLSDSTFAMIHGCFAAAFFAVCASTAVVTGPWWTGVTVRPDDETSPAMRPMGWFLPLVTMGLAYGQLVLGAMLRHVAPTTLPRQFALTVGLHVIGAFLLWLMTGLAWRKARRCGDLTLSRSAAWLIGLVAIQIALGIGTWVVNYSWPSILRWVPGSESFLVRSKGFIDSLVVTGHVATGSLILALAAVLLVRVLRIRWLERQSPAREPGSDQGPSRTAQPLAETS